MPSPLRIQFVDDKKLIEATELIPNIKIRSKMVLELIRSYGLLERMHVVSSRLASTEELLSFHSPEYLEYLERLSSVDVDDMMETHNSNLENKQMIDFGFGYDCPMIKNVEKFAKIIAGGTLKAVDGLMSGNYDVAINWCGGWHHAQRDEASGFCYINDIVIGIQALQRKFKKVLYIDLDVHHGDGVENAFSFSKNVFTVSLHNFEAGYFPGTGKISDVGRGKGKNFTLNVPFKSGMSDSSYVSVFSMVLDSVCRKFPAEAVVVQCGGDSMAGDPLGTFNLTEIGVGRCLQKILNLCIPSLILGGGGYNLPTTAKCWTYLTSIICGEELNTEIPEHIYFPAYGPDFDLHISPTLRKDENSQEYLSQLLDTIKRKWRQKFQGSLKRIPKANLMKIYRVCQARVLQVREIVQEIFQKNILSNIIMKLRNRTMIFREPIHDYIYQRQYYKYPFLVATIIFLICTGIIRHPALEGYVYRTPINLITFILMETTFSTIQILLSLACERGIHIWWNKLDLYKDYINDGYVLDSPQFWKDIGLTPSLFLLIANMQSLINTLACLSMNTYTKARIGTAAMFTILFIITFSTTLFSLLLMRTFSYRTSFMWDSFQVYMGGSWSIFATGLYIHYIDRVVQGKTVRLNGMRWKDILFIALRLCFI